MTKGAIVRNQRWGDSYRIRLSKLGVCRCSFRYLMSALSCHKDIMLIDYRAQSYIIISYKVVYGENSSSVFSSKLSMVLINDSPYRREAPSYS